MTPIVILAAGASSRLGTPKQLIPYNGLFLLQHAVNEAAATGEQVIVVLGANADSILPSIKGEPVYIAVNPDWKEGPGTSIAVGIKTVETITPRADGVLLMLCDQPFADRYLLRRMLGGKNESGKGIVACDYGSTMGVPALFSRQYFELLKLLPPGQGAKSLLSLHASDLSTVSFPKGVIDIDTAEDYGRCLVDGGGY